MKAGARWKMPAMRSLAVCTSRSRRSRSASLCFQPFQRQPLSGGVAEDLGEAAQLATFIAQRHHHAVGEKAAAVGALVQAPVLGAAGGQRALG